MIYNMPGKDPLVDNLKTQLNLLIQNQESLDGRSFIAKLNELLAQELKKIGIEDSSLSIADLCFLPINENKEFDSTKPILSYQKIQLEDILSQFIDNDFSALLNDGVVRLMDGQEFIIGKLLRSEKINGQPSLPFKMLSGNASNPDPTIASFESQQSNFAQKLFEETFAWCRKPFHELTPAQQQIFTDATLQASDDLVTKASLSDRIDPNSLQKISLMELNNLAKQINETFEASFHQLLITTSDPHCQDPDAFALGYSQNSSLIDNYLIGRDQDDLVSGFWQNYLSGFSASQNIKSSGLLTSPANSSTQDLLKLFQGSLALKLPFNEIIDPTDKACFVPAKIDLVKYVVNYLNLTKARIALAGQCDDQTTTLISSPLVTSPLATSPNPIIPNTTIPQSPPDQTTPQSQSQNKIGFTDQIENSVKIEFVSALLSEIIRFTALNSEKFKKIPKHHQQNIFWSIDTATRFAVIAILANQDKLSTIASLSIASASSISLKKITSMSYEKLKGYSDVVKQLGEKFSSIPQPSKAFIETGALVALYQGFNQLLLRDQDPDKSQSQQFSESMAIIACTSLVAGITRGLLRYLSNNILEKLNPRANHQPDQELGNVGVLTFEQERTAQEPPSVQSPLRSGFLRPIETGSSLAERLLPSPLQIRTMGNAEI